MMRFTVFLAALLVFVTATPALGVEWPAGNIQWKIVYEGNGLPTETSPAWKEYGTGRFRVGSTTEDGVDFLRIDTIDAAATLYYAAPGYDVDFADGVLISLRARVHPGTTHQGGVLIGSRNQQFVSIHFTQTHLRFDTDSGPKYYKIADFHGVWHEYRIAIKDDQYAVYMDDLESPVYKGTVMTGEFPEIDWLIWDASRTMLLFGDMRELRPIKIDYDYIRYAPLSAN